MSDMNSHCPPIGHTCIFDIGVAQVAHVPSGISGVKRMQKLRVASVLLAISTLAACSPAVGSKAWCENIAEKPKGDWTANEAADYLQHCLVRSDQ